MATKLTAVTIASAPPRAARYELPDSVAPGLRLVVQPTGMKSWAFRFRRQDGSSAKLTIGPFPAIDLKTARARALQAASHVSDKQDPAKAKKAAREAARALAKPSEDETTAAAIETFTLRHGKEKNRESHWRETRRILDRVLAPWAGRRLSEVSARNIHAILDAALDRGARTMANRELAALRTFFRWAVARGLLSASPCAGIGAPAPTTSRERVLSPEELAIVWQGAEQIGFPFGPLVILLLLTGQRRGEAASIRADDLDLEREVWTIPAAIAKNGHAHVVHLAPQAIDILRAASERDRTGDFLFGGKTAPSGWSKAKRRLDSVIGAAIREPWTLHDLRRSAATGLAERGVTVPVIERILNHKSGVFKGIVGVYQRHDYLDERKQALTLWAEYLGSIQLPLQGSPIREARTDLTKWG